MSASVRLPVSNRKVFRNVFLSLLFLQLFHSAVTDCTRFFQLSLNILNFYQRFMYPLQTRKIYGMNFSKLVFLQVFVHALRTDANVFLYTQKLPALRALQYHVGHYILLNGYYYPIVIKQQYELSYLFCHVEIHFLFCNYLNKSQFLSYILQYPSPISAPIKIK